MATTFERGSAFRIRSGLHRSTPPSCSDLPQSRLRRVPADHARGILAAAPSRAERAAAGGELRVLRLGPSMVAGPAVCHHVRRLLGGARYGRSARAGAPTTRT